MSEGRCFHESQTSDHLEKYIAFKRFLKVYCVPDNSIETIHLISLLSFTEFYCRCTETVVSEGYTYYFPKDNYPEL